MTNLPEAAVAGLDIAIIGMAGRFPGADDIERFWQNLRAGVESISFFSDAELAAQGVTPEILRRPDFVKARGVLEGVELFDAEFFGCSPAEAEVMDPQHRLFLECAWEALENAGYDPDGLPGPAGVYAGASLDSYLLSQLLPRLGATAIDGNLPALIGNEKDFLATRVSYKLNLRGPSINVQSACSTSLVAIHLACHGLLNFECDVALAGGVTATAFERMGYVAAEGGIASRDGHCRAFDARATGAVGGSGVGVLVLKRLEDALVAGDTIHAVIKGSAVNNDGALKVGLTAPSEIAQAEVIEAAQTVAGVPPDSIRYVEAHGTGTTLGDPIEVRALTRAFRRGTQARGHCALASLKTNVGHLDAAAGVAGLIKATLAVAHGEIPPSLHFERPNPELELERSPFYVPTRLMPWPRSPAPRRAGVSSFGMGGTNVHMVVEQPPARVPAEGVRQWHLIVLSARTAPALDAARRRLAEHLERHPELALADVAYTSQVGRRAFRHRSILVTSGREDTIARLRDAAVPVAARMASTPAPKVVFMFPGQGAQHAAMGAELYRTEPVFRHEIDQCAELLRPHLALDIRTHLLADRGEALVSTALAQPALFMLEYALARLWMSFGLRPEAFIGHSLGEYVAACLAGVFSLADGLALVSVRGRLMDALPTGAMLTVPLAREQVEALLDEELSVAAHNGPERCVVSGPTGAIDALESRLAMRAVSCRRLRTSHAFHSPMMEPMRDAFRQQIAALRLQPPAIPYVSCLTGTWVTAEEATRPEYWAAQLRHTVRFADALGELLRESPLALVEVGPGHGLGELVRQHQARRAGHTVVTSLRRPESKQSDAVALLESLGRLWMEGVRLDWSGVHAGEYRRRVPLPTYPFERRRYWLGPVIKQALSATAGGEVGKTDMADWFYLPVWKHALRPSSISSAPLEAGAPWLVFLDAEGLGAQLCVRLEALGLKTVTVETATGFAQRTPRSFAVRPDGRADYDALVSALRDSGQLPARVVHLWSVASSAMPSGPARLDEAIVRGFHSLNLLAAALSRHCSGARVHIDVISKDMQDVAGEARLQPEQAVSLAPCIVIPQEFPSISCRSIDIAGPDAGPHERAGIAELLLAELASPPTERAIAYRGNHRFVQTFERQRTPAGGRAASPLRRRGVYLIAGGLGNVGLTIAAHLGETEHARLVLTGRSGLPPREDWDCWVAAQSESDAATPIAPLHASFLAPLIAPSPRLCTDLAEERAFLHERHRDLARDLAIRPISAYAGLQRGLDQLTASYIYDYLCCGELTPDRTLRQSDLRVRLGIRPEFDRLFEFMLDVMAEEGVLQRAGEELRWAPSVLPDPQLLRSELARQHPDFAGLFDLIDHCLRRYRPVLCGEINPLSVLYPDGTPKLLAEFEARTVEHRQSRLLRALARDFVARAVRASAHRTVRILEVGGGTGALTQMIAPTLEHENVQYHCTDIGRLFVRRLEEESRRRGADFMQFGVLDISRDPSAQGYPLYGFDIVLGLDVVHATARIDEALAHLRSLLAPRGLLVLIETTRAERWTHLVEGLTKEWWQFEDERVQRRSPLLSPDEWRKALHRAGFAVVTTSAEDDGADSMLLAAQQPAALAGERFDRWGAEQMAAEREVVRARIRAVRAIEEKGAEVVVEKADVTDRGAMLRAVQQTAGRFGDLHGVIFAAGPEARSFKPITQTTAMQITDHFRAKGHGLFVLDEVLQGRVLDFCLLVSSNAAVLGGLGFAAYTAACLFMDAFAHQQSRRGLPWRSSNWDGWPVLIEGRHGSSPSKGASLAQMAMTRDEAGAAFRRALALGVVPQVIVATGDLGKRIEQWSSGQLWRSTAEPPPRHDDVGMHPRPDLPTPFAAPENELQRSIAAVWQQMLGVAEIGIDDSFFELGGDSLLGVQLVSRLRDTFQLELPLQSLFEAPTVRGMALAVGCSRDAERIVPPIESGLADDADLESLVEEIDRLSDEQARALLASRG